MEHEGIATQEAAAPPRIEELLSDEEVFAAFRTYVYARVKRSATEYRDSLGGIAHDVSNLLPLYLQLQQIDQAEHHYADIRKRDDEWKAAVAERDRQIVTLQERYVKAEEELTEVHRQHAKAIQEQQAQALEDEDRLVEEHLRLIEQVRQHPESFTVIASSLEPRALNKYRSVKRRLKQPEPPMSLEEYESSAKEP